MSSPKLWYGFASTVLQPNFDRLDGANSFITPALVSTADHLHLGALLLKQL